jgi:FMN phosphatase YigB (HAD superfamily)
MMKAILFDFGGTLDTNGIHWSEKYWEVYCYFNVPVSKKQYEESYVYSEKILPGIIKPNYNYQATILKQIEIQLLFLEENKYLDGKTANVFSEKLTGKCYSDVLDTAGEAGKLLEQLSRQYKLGVVSNFYGNLDTVLQELSLLKYFNTVIDSSHTGIRKPDPQIFRMAVDKLNASATATTVIGDSYDRDIQPAKKLGCSTIWLDGKSWRRPQNTVDADVTIRSLYELPKYLLIKKPEKI